MLEEFINSLTYDDSDYFSVEETCFLRNSNFSEIVPRFSQQQLETDRKAPLSRIQTKKRLVPLTALIIENNGICLTAINFEVFVQFDEKT